MYQYILIASHINIVIEEYLMTWENIYNTFDAPNHNAELEHYEAIEYMQDMGAKIIKTNLKKNKVEENEKN